MPFGASADALAEVDNIATPGSIRKEMYSSIGKHDTHHMCSSATVKKKKPGLKARFEEDSSLQDETYDEGFKDRQKRFEEHVKKFLKNVDDPKFDQLSDDIPDFMPK